MVTRSGAHCIALPRMTPLVSPYDVMQWQKKTICSLDGLDMSNAILNHVISKRRSRKRSDAEAPVNGWEKNWLGI